MEENVPLDQFTELNDIMASFDPVENEKLEEEIDQLQAMIAQKRCFIQSLKDNLHKSETIQDDLVHFDLFLLKRYENLR